jgi:hypothetical protein
MKIIPIATGRNNGRPAGSGANACWSIEIKIEAKAAATKHNSIDAHYWNSQWLDA